MPQVLIEHVTPNQNDVISGTRYGHLGTFDYTYGTASNVVTALQSASLNWLDSDRSYDYDGLDRLVTAKLTDWQTWFSPSMPLTSWSTYDDLGSRESHWYRTGGPAIAYAHDKAGNLTNGYSIDRSIRYLYEYDHLSKLAAVHSQPHAKSV